MSVPIDWSELAQIDGGAYWTVRNIGSRIAVGYAPRGAAGSSRQTLTKAMKALDFKHWSPKRERQDEHIKSSLRERGKATKLAEEIAARTVNKDRAQHDEAKEASASSVNDISAGRTLAQLRNEASERGLKGRSTMDNAHLESALKR